MGFIFEGLIEATLTLSGMYLILSIFTYYKLSYLQRNTLSTSGLTLQKLFVMTCLLTCILRFMSFASMSLLYLGRVKFKIDNTGSFDSNDDFTDDDKYSNHTFLEKAILVLFDFPDFCFVSAYVLLFVVWAETYLKSRRHWLSSMRFRRVWIFGYFIFNVLLYTTQLALYSLIFIPTINEYVQTNLIYFTLAGFSLLLPAIWLVTYLYMACIFSGFPFSTLAAKLRLRYLSRLGLLWTCARMTWGLIAMTSVLQGWLTQARRSEMFYSVVLICVFALVEMIPIIFSLQLKVLQSLSENDILVVDGHENQNTIFAFKPDIVYKINNHFSGIPNNVLSNEELDSFQYDEDHLVHLLTPSGSTTPKHSNEQSDNSNLILHSQGYQSPSLPTLPNVYQTTTSTPKKIPTTFPQLDQNSQIEQNQSERKEGDSSLISDEHTDSSFDRSSFYTASTGVSPPTQSGFWEHIFGFK